MFAVTQFVMVMRYKAECCESHFPWDQFGRRFDSAPSFMSISGIHWGVIRTELGANTLRPTTFLDFTKVARSGRSVNS